MLQRALGALLCVLGLVVAGLAVASATVWRAPDTLSATASAGSDGTVVMTDPGVLDLAAQEVTVRAEAPGATVVLALGRTVDVAAWVGQDPVTRVTGLEDRETLAVEEGPAAPTEPSPTPDPQTPATEDGATQDAGTEDAEAAPEETAEGEPAAEDEAAAEPTEVADPRGSDLWVEEVSGEDAVELQWRAEEGRWSVLAVSLDATVAPTLTLTWAQEVTTPWLVPGLVVGAVLFLAGVALLLLALRSRRSRRRQEDAPGPSSAPLPPRPAPTASGASAAGASSGAAGAVADGTVAAGAAAATDRPLTRRELRERQARGLPVPVVAPTPVPAPPAPSDTGSAAGSPGTDRPAPSDRPDSTGQAAELSAVPDRPT
ncbi:MAG: hypothetical protein H5T83_06050, partial [Actinotalea sp.]|nr:hypothetical protein [Actinotalea sp.]